MLLWLPDLCSLVEDRDWDVAWTQDGMLHLSHKGLLSLLRAQFWWYVRSICRQLSDLFRVVSWVIPGCCAIIMIHKEGPSGLRVNFDFPAEGKRVVVITRHRQDR